MKFRRGYKELVFCLNWQFFKKDHLWVSDGDCQEDEFKCAKGLCRYVDEPGCSLTSPCIPISWRCDDFPDCTDGSDEQACGGNVTNL